MHFETKKIISVIMFLLIPSMGIFVWNIFNIFPNAAYIPLLGLGGLLFSAIVTVSLTIVAFFLFVPIFLKDYYGYPVLRFVFFVQFVLQMISLFSITFFSF